MQLYGPHKTPSAVPAPGDVVFCNSHDNSTIGVVTAALLDDLFTVLITDNSTADVGGDTEHAPCAVDKSATDAATPPAGDNTARNLSIDFACALSLGYHNEEYCLLIQVDGVEMLWCAPTTSPAQPHELIQKFLNYSGIQVRSIRFDNAMEFSQSDHFKSWVKAKGSVLCPTENYNQTLNSKSECYVRITKEHLRCIVTQRKWHRTLETRRLGMSTHS